MGDNLKEIRDDEIKFEEIMRRIRENIRRNQATEALYSDADTVIASISNNFHLYETDEVIQRDLSYINANWDIHNNKYFINSHHRYIGKFLVKGRQLVNEEVHRYVDPMISYQTEFNNRTVRIISWALQYFTELDLRQKELETAYSSLNHKVKENIDTRFKELFTEIDIDIHKRVWLTHVLEDRFQKELTQKHIHVSPPQKEDINYFLFEERFRGSREDIKKRQMAFLPYFEKSSRVLDIGCGRGEFLEILKDHNIGGIGIDSDPDMVKYCCSIMLTVEQSDAIAYLETLEDDSIDGIFIDQVIEHLEPDYLVRLLALCHRKIKSGYFIVVETVNPLSFVSFVNFYIDLTHKRPVHPETLEYLLIASGFNECEKKFFSPVCDEGKLKKIIVSAYMNETEMKNVDIYNHNVETLNAILFGAQDYAVIGKK